MEIKKAIVLLLSLVYFTSCLDAGGTRPLGNKSNNSTNGGNQCSGANCDSLTGGGDNSVTGDDEEVIAKVEIRHLVEPKIDDADEGGEHKRKLTIPKNYDGYLYIAGINISSLSSKSVSVRFKFGLDGSPIIIPGTISTAPGLTPQTNVEVLVLDLKKKPFYDVQLLYELYDYNTYDFAATGSDPAALTEPVSFNRNDKLYCRGLKLEDDNTFTGSVASGCVGSSDICKFSYAKIVDKGLVESGSPEVPIIPGEKNVQRSSVGYYGEENSTKLGRCLPNNPDLTGGAYVFDLSNSFNGLESVLLIDGQVYIYRGPYRPINDSNWQISADAIVGQYGLFKKVPDFNNNGVLDSAEVQYGQQSLLFPLYTKLDLLKDVQYMGSSVADGTKVLTTMTSNGESTYLDGCNARASTVDDITGEHIGSCNITGTIEIIATDDDGSETVVDITNDVKLQLVKPSELNTNGENVLLSSFEQCSSSGQCGSDSCCINKRCWSKSLVSQCVEDLPNFGNLETGDTCNSDYECASLCCNKVDGRCAPHDTLADTPIYCSKPTGQSCVSKEFCQKNPVRTCAIVLGEPDQYGGKTCSLRCITAEVYGECTADDGSGPGVCKPPCQPTAPVFNPSDPNRCAEAMTFSQLEQLANNPECGG